MVLLHLILLSLFASLSLSTKFTAALDTLSPNKTLLDATGGTLVSAGESFELGFFSPPNSEKRYVGIWFKQVSLRTPIWVANKNDPLTNSSGVLTITPTGNIIITSNQTNPIWSSNSTILSASTPVLKLLDTGNLVVVNTNTGNYSWQSFDYPCDTLVPGMKLGWDLSKNQEWYLTSWKSLEDPSTGDFTYRVDPRGLPQIALRKGSTIQYRSGPWDGVRFGGSPPLKENTVFSPSFAFNESFVYYSFVNSADNIISRFVVNQPGGLIQHLTWNQGSGEWVVIATVQVDTCDTYELCGPYGICSINESPNICHCADGFVPKSPLAWKRFDGRGGCVAKTELNCSVAAGFRKFSKLKLPDTSYFLVNRTQVSRVDCEEACLRNCSCMGFAQTEVSGCVVWSGELLDMREYNEGGQDLYIRMAASELGDQQYLKSQQSHGKKGKVAAIAASVTAALLLTFCLFCWFVVKKRKETREEKNLLFSPYNTTSLEASSMGKHFDGSGTNAELPYFDLSIIVSATDNFSLANKLGEGGFGTVYKGRLHDGEEIAVKRLAKNSGQGVEEFKTEVTLIAKLQHRNLVRLLGYCIQREEKMLIYEYLPNKGLDSFVFDRTKSSFIDWKTRFNIILGIARGLLYLHQDSRLRIIHRDLKASNVLLDAEMNPKISDFGMARIFGGNQIEANTNRVVGTYGYMSPEYAMEGLFSIKSDVFSFGVLLLEIISGRKNSSYYKDNSVNLIGHVWSLWNEGRAEELVDSTMSESYSDKEVLRCIHIGLLCVQESANDRPNMSDVAFMLCNETVLTPPKQPAFIFKGADSRPETSSSASLGAVSVNDVTMSAIRGR